MDELSGAVAVQRAVAALAAGGMVVVADDTDSHGTAFTVTADLVRYRRATEQLIEHVATSTMPTLPTAARWSASTASASRGAQILADLGVRRLRLITNNPARYGGLDGHGLDIVGRVGLPTVENPHNVRYLRTKQDRMGHLGLAR